MIEIYKNNERNKILNKIDSFEKTSWIKVTDPNEEEIEKLVSELKLNKEEILDGLDINEMPRIEQEEDNLYIFARIPTNKINQEPTSSFLTIITKDYFITISKYNLEIFDSLIEDKHKFFTNQKSRSLMKFFHLISRQFELSVRRIFKEVKIDKKTIGNSSNKDILSLVLQEDILNNYNYSFKPMTDIYARAIKNKLLKFTEKDKEFIEDLIIDLKQIANMNLLALKTISNIRGYYSTTVSNKLNDIITILTLFTIFLTIPTMIAGIYGMNIILPLQQNKNILFILLGIVILIWAILFIIIKKKKII